MVKALYVVSATGIKETREWAVSANEALRTVRTLMKLRRPGVRIEDQRGNPISFFELKDLADSENRKSKTKRP